MMRGSILGDSSTFYFREIEGMKPVRETSFPLKAATWPMGR